MGETTFDKIDSSFILPLFALSPLKLKQMFYPLLDHHLVGSSLFWFTDSLWNSQRRNLHNESTYIEDEADSSD